MSKHRYTVDAVGGGQRPYGPTIRRTQIFYEWQGMEGYSNKNAPFVISDIDNESIVRRDAKHHSGWCEKGEGDWASTRLNYLKKIGPGLWEWETETPYDD